LAHIGAIVGNQQSITHCVIHPVDTQCHPGIETG
jgi:hypothetical protein